MSSVLRIIALSSVLVHLWTGCGSCCAFEHCSLGQGSEHRRHTALEHCEAMARHSCCCHHDGTGTSPAQNHNNCPCDSPCNTPDDHCDCCECAFVVPNDVNESDSLASEISQTLTLLSVSQPVQPELSSRPTFSVPSPEYAIPDSRSLRAQIAVFLL